jgi:hypothetical protein
MSHGYQPHPGPERVAPPPRAPSAAPRRTVLQRLFRGGLGRPLVNLWIETRDINEFQRITDSQLKLGRYTVLRWQSIRTDMDAFERD